MVFSFVQGKSFKKNKILRSGLCLLLFALASFGVGIYTSDGFASLPDNVISINITAIKDHLQGVSLLNTADTYEKFFEIKK